MNVRAAITMAVVWTLLLAGCQSAPVLKTDYAESVDFAEYSTFTWISDTPLSFHEMTSHVSPLLQERLKEAAKREFGGRGLKFVEDTDQADLLLSFTVGSRDRILLEGYARPTVYADAYGEGEYWVDNSRYLGKFVEGQVCVDLFDRESGRPVWHGTTREPIFEPDVDYWRESIGEIVSLIASAYPPESAR